MEKLFLFISLTIAKPINVLISAYFGGSSQLTMFQVANELQNEKTNNGEPKFNVTLLVNSDTITDFRTVRLQFNQSEMTVNNNDSTGNQIK